MKYQILYIFFLFFLMTSICNAVDQVFGYFDPVTGQFVNLSPNVDPGAETSAYPLYRPYRPKLNLNTGREIKIGDIRDPSIQTVTNGQLADGNDFIQMEAAPKEKPKFVGPEGTKLNRGVAKKCAPPGINSSGSNIPGGGTTLPSGLPPSKNGFLNRNNFSPCDLNEGPIRPQTSQSQINGQGVLLAAGGALQIIQAQNFAPQDEAEVLSGVGSLNPILLIDFGRGLPRTAANIARVDTITALNRADILYQTGQISAQSYLLSIEATPGLSQRRKEEIIQKLGLRRSNCKVTSFSEIYNPSQGNR